MRPFLHANYGLSWRWFIHRFHAGRDYHAWQGHRAKAGAVISVGPLRIQVVLLRWKGDR